MPTLGNIDFDDNAFADAVSLVSGDPFSADFSGLIGSSNQSVANIGTSNNSPDILVEFTDNAAVNAEGVDVFIYVPGEVFAVVASLTADFLPETTAQAAGPTPGSEIFFDNNPLNPFSFNPNSLLLALDLDDLGVAAGDTVSSLFLRRGDIEGAIYGVGAVNNGPAAPDDPVDPIDPVDPVDPVDPPIPVGPTSGGDTLNGSAQNDTISALAGDDNVRGLAGDDLIRGGGGADNIRGNGGDDRLRGNGGDDTLRGNGGDDNINGNGGADLIRGNGGGDVINGGGGADDVRGGGGADQITGGGGADQLNGGGGADTLRGNAGDDTLTGNGGADVFQFRTSDRNDTIADFRQGQDRIEILNGAQSFDALDIQQDGQDVLISFGVAGQIRVVTDNAGAFDESDFIF